MPGVNMQDEIERLRLELEESQKLVNKLQHENMSLKQHQTMLCNSIKMLVDLPNTGGLNE